jgi:hypothetical protein
MLRITVEKNDGVIIFRLEGKLKGEWVAELELRQEHKPNPPIVH